MIKTLTTQDPYLVIEGGYNSSPYISPGAGGAGHLRWNSSMQEMEVNDGVTWRSLGSNPTTIYLAEDAKNAIGWALKKMQEERELEDRMQRHPGLRDTWEKFKIMEALCQEDDARQPNS